MAPWGVPVAVSIDGVLVAPATASISVFDRGLLYGDGLFEVLRTWCGVPIELPAHLDRLFAAVEALGMKTLPRDQIRDAVERTVAAAGTGEQRIRIVLTRGAGGLAARFAELPRGRSIVIVEPLGDQPESVTLAIVEWSVPRRSGAALKTLAYLDHVIAKELARAAGADEAVRLDAEGWVAEGATSNVFVVTGGIVRTPALAGVLPGIVRARVLELCPRVGVAAEVGSVAREDLLRADEVFVTSSLRGVVSVTRLDGQARAVGPVSEKVAAAYRAEMVARSATSC